MSEDDPEETPEQIQIKLLLGKCPHGYPYGYNKVQDEKSKIWIEPIPTCKMSKCRVSSSFQVGDTPKQRPAVAWHDVQVAEGTGFKDAAPHPQNASVFGPQSRPPKAPISTYRYFASPQELAEYDRLQAGRTGL